MNLIFKHVFLLIGVLFWCIAAQAQLSVRVQVKDSKTLETIPDVNVFAKGSNRGGTTDTSGRVTVTGLNTGAYTIVCMVLGYETKYVSVLLPDTTEHLVLLEQSENTLTEVKISSTRDDRQIENAPMRVEAVDRAEIQEEQATRPANVAGLLSDIGGIKVQQTSAVSGNANIRIQGLDGRYTQILRDGMPLYDGLSGGFGILQIAPLDLKQIELIKGPASTLYGGGAIGGLINFISKKPSTTQEAELIVNGTSQTETNAHFFLAKRYNKWGYTLYGGYTGQQAVDVNHDGFSDVPETQSFSLHPTIFFYPNDKTTISAGFSLNTDRIKGGDMQALSGNSDSLHQYYQHFATTRNTGELQADRKFNHDIKGVFKGSASSFDETITTNTHYFKGNQLNYFSEASLFIPKGKLDWVAGIDMTGNAFTKRPSDRIPIENFSNNIVGAFGQLNIRLRSNTNIQAGLRIDEHSKYGLFALPCIAAIHHISNAFAVRGGFGMGYKAPNALDQLSTDYRMEQLLPVGDSVKPEKSYGYNLEVNYKKQWEYKKRLFINSAFFLTNITTPVIATELPIGLVLFSNAAKPIVTRGFDNYVKLQLGEFEAYAGYTYTIAERKYLATNQFTPLIPRNHLAVTASYEVEGKWRFGAEFDATGSQYRDNDRKTPAFTTFGAIVEKDFLKHYAVLLNVENLFDYRQSGYESLYTGSRISPNFKPIWGPLNGRVTSFVFRARL